MQLSSVFEQHHNIYSLVTYMLTVPYRHCQCICVSLCLCSRYELLFSKI